MNEQPLPKHISALLKPEVYEHAVTEIQLIETHISWVILTGAFAYKIKKAVNLGFLDFSSLEKRQFYCYEELRLNKRFAPQLYREVTPVSLINDKVQLTASAQIVDYAIKMTQFAQDHQFDKMLEAERIRPEHIDQFATNLVAFHQRCAIADATVRFGNIEAVLQPVKDNFQHLRQLINEPNALKLITQLEHWFTHKVNELSPLFSVRKQQGFVRECHGDLHSRNLVVLDDDVVAFDCIEFSEELRWIDVISDVAFTVMDLHFRHHPHYASRLLNQYLESSGDYLALTVLRFYLIYRALVRAKVEAISTSQNVALPDKNSCYQYLSLAHHYTQVDKPHLIITYGLSASGKSTLSAQLCELLPAIRIRSDVERKRLFKKANSEALYSKISTQDTYQHLLQLSETIIACAYSVIVDATFLQHEHRQQFLALAIKQNVEFLILNLKVSTEQLRQRIQKREPGVSDADLTVLEHQTLNHDALTNKERAYVIDVEPRTRLDELVTEINARHHLHN